MHIRKLSRSFIVVIATVLQFSPNYGVTLEGMESTTEILTRKKKPRWTTKKPKWGGQYGNVGEITFQEFLYICGILLGLLLLFVIFKFWLWRRCRKCCEEEEEEEGIEDPRRSFSFATDDAAISIPQQHFRTVTDVYDSIDNDNYPFDVDLPLEYSIQEYNEKSSQSFPKIRNSTSETVC